MPLPKATYNNYICVYFVVFDVSVVLNGFSIASAIFVLEDKTL